LPQSSASGHGGQARRLNDALPHLRQMTQFVVVEYVTAQLVPDLAQQN
jgi:hypothetical protein